MFTTRLISGIILVLIALVTVGSGGMILFATTVAISMIGLFELYRVMKIQKNVIGIAGYLTVVSYYGLLWFHGEQYMMLMSIAFLMILMTIYVFTFPKYKTDEVILYGIKPDSKYIDADLEDSEGVYISSAYAEKFLLKPGDSITLKEKYEKTKYTFKVKGIYKYSGGICVFMPQEQLNDTFDLGNDYFSGYFSNSKIKDIDEKYIGSVLDLEALTKISRQLDVSMGNMMSLVNAFAIGIYMVVIYLLSKIIIEKNAQAISMTKILGYTNGEISRLYIWPTTIVVIICLLLSLPIEKAVMNVLFREMMLTSISGWIALWIDPKIYVEMFLIGIGTYAVVAMIEYRRIKHVPMDEALKNVE